VLGLYRVDYLALFSRTNLIRGTKWSAPLARRAAREVAICTRGAPLVLLGAKVCAAFGVPFAPFETLDFGEPLKAAGCPELPGGLLGSGWYPKRMVILPHPSGLSRAWNDPSAVQRARAAVDELIEEKLCRTTQCRRARVFGARLCEKCTEDAVGDLEVT
jgi:hypothetical protein